MYSFTKQNNFFYKKKEKSPISFIFLLRHIKRIGTPSQLKRIIIIYLYLPQSVCHADTEVFIRPVTRYMPV